MDHRGRPGVAGPGQDADGRPILLDEERWLDAIDEIVGRDFFPDAPRPVRPEGSVDVTGLSLDEFLHTYTSEDNASFREILDKTNARRREKMAHLMLPPAAQPGADQGRLEGKKYEAINLLMYDGSTRSSLPLARIGAGPHGVSKRIHHRSTSLAATTTATGPRDDRAPVGTGPIPDTTSPGYSLLETPSFHPNDGMTPFMTWGDIDHTPMRLEDDGETAEHGRGGAEDAPKRSEFRMRDTPQREQLAHSLGGRGTGASGLFSSRGKHTPGSMRTPGSVGKSPSIHAMSPAARRLAAQQHATRGSGRVVRNKSIFARPRSSWDDA